MKIPPSFHQQRSKLIPNQSQKKDAQANAAQNVPNNKQQANHLEAKNNAHISKAHIHGGGQQRIETHMSIAHHHMTKANESMLT